MKINLNVRDCMEKNVRLISRKTTVALAAKEMMKQKVSSFLIEPSSDSDTFGIITRKDLVETLISAYSDENVLLVEDVMTHPALSVSPSLSVDLAQQIMRMVGVRRLPVIEGGELVGIISNSDILSAFVRQTDCGG